MALRGQTPHRHRQAVALRGQTPHRHQAAGDFVREVRRRHGLTQASLARRAGTSQAAISDIERGVSSPTVETLERLLLCVGERLVLGTERLPSDLDHDPIAFARTRSQSMEERLAEGLAWARIDAV